jgi:hypothetical protein
MKNLKNDTDLKYQSQSIDLLLKEYDTLRDEMKLYLRFLRQDTRMILLILGVIVAFGKTADFDIHALLPVIPSIVFVFILSQFMSIHMISTEANACADIENRVNKIVGDKVMCWESEIAKSKVRGLFSVTTLSTLFIILAAFTLFIYASSLVPNNKTIFPCILHVTEGLIILSIFIRLCHLEWKNVNK